MKLGTTEYQKETQKRANEDEELRRLAKAENESYTFVMKAEPDKGVPEEVVLGQQLRDGEIIDVWIGLRDTDFTMTARYGVWVDILRGKLSFDKAVLLRKIKLKGGLLKLIKYKSNDRYVEILLSIPTEFEGDYARYNTPGKAL